MDIIVYIFLCCGIVASVFSLIGALMCANAASDISLAIKFYGRMFRAGIIQLLIALALAILL